MYTHYKAIAVPDNDRGAGLPIMIKWSPPLTKLYHGLRA